MNYVLSSLINFLAFARRSEVNLGIEKASFTVMRHYSPPGTGTGTRTGSDDRVRVTFPIIF